MYYKSFVPASVRAWNQLGNNIKQLPILGHFKNALKRQMFSKKIKHFSQCKGKAAINHTRMRLGLSHLRQHLHSHHIIESPYCPNSCWDRLAEGTEHYFLHCPQYAASRDQMLGGLGPTVDKLGVNRNIEIVKLILNGHSELSFAENISLLRTVQQFINNTGRF